MSYPWASKTLWSGSGFPCSSYSSKTGKSGSMSTNAALPFFPVWWTADLGRSALVISFETHTYSMRSTPLSSS